MRKSIQADPAHLLSLSFVTKGRKGEGLDFWAVDPVSDYSAACNKGRALGAEYLAFIGKYPTNGNAALLGWIVHSIAEKAAAGRKAGGIEVGFFKAVNEYALAAAKLLAEPNNQQQPEIRADH